MAGLIKFHWDTMEHDEEAEQAEQAVQTEEPTTIEDSHYLNHKPLYFENENKTLSSKRNLYQEEGNALFNELFIANEYSADWTKTKDILRD